MSPSGKIVVFAITKILFINPSNGYIGTTGIRCTQCSILLLSIKITFGTVLYKAFRVKFMQPGRVCQTARGFASLHTLFVPAVREGEDAQRPGSCLEQGLWYRGSDPASGTR